MVETFVAPKPENDYNTSASGTIDQPRDQFQTIAARSAGLPESTDMGQITEVQVARAVKAEGLPEGATYDQMLEAERIHTAKVLGLPEGTSSDQINDVARAREAKMLGLPQTATFEQIAEAQQHVLVSHEKHQRSVPRRSAAKFLLGRFIH